MGAFTQNGFGSAWPNASESLSTAPFSYGWAEGALFFISLSHSRGEVVSVLHVGTPVAADEFCQA